MLQLMLDILNQMDFRDANVMQLKILIESQLTSKKVYYLRYKKSKKPIMVTVRSNLDADYCNDTTVTLSDYGDCIWYTNSLIIAAYNKYVSTPWFNSTNEQCVHNYKPEDVEIVDIYGKVYDVKPLTNKTITIIKNYMRTKNGLKNNDENWLNSYADLTSYHIIDECKQFKSKLQSIEIHKQQGANK